MNLPQFQPDTPSPQKRTRHHALFHLEEGQTDTPINSLHLGVGPALPSPAWICFVKSVTLQRIFS
jgi:hypothetical protein